MALVLALVLVLGCLLVFLGAVGRCRNKQNLTRIRFWVFGGFHKSWAVLVRLGLLLHLPSFLRPDPTVRLRCLGWWGWGLVKPIFVSFGDSLIPGTWGWGGGSDGGTGGGVDGVTVGGGEGGEEPGGSCSGGDAEEYPEGKG